MLKGEYGGKQIKPATLYSLKSIPLALKSLIVDAI
jgi:hypothetical protein